MFVENSIKIALKPTPLVLCVILYLVTGGFYGVYWLFSRSRLINKMMGGKSYGYSLAKYALGIWLVLLLIILAAMIVSSESGPFPRIFPFFAFAPIAAIIVYALFAVVSVEICDLIVQDCGNVKCSRVVVIVLTVLGFLSPIYLQRKVNEMARHAGDT